MGMRTGRQAGGQAGKQAEDRKAGGGLAGGQAGREADRKTNKNCTVNVETLTSKQQPEIPQFFKNSFSDCSPNKRKFDNSPFCLRKINGK
jgi:hypothetical protein